VEVSVLRFEFSAFFFLGWFKFLFNFSENEKRKNLKKKIYRFFHHFF
jgi:hypothetical protein